MNISTRTLSDVQILDLEGKITSGESAVALRQAVSTAFEAGHKQILLNMKDVNYMDSSGLGELVSAYAKVKHQGGQLKLLNLTNKLHEVLAITKLLTVFECFDNESQAVNSYFR